MFMGTLFLCLSILVLIITLLGARHPSQPEWASAFMVQYVWVIVILGLAATGVSLIAFAFASEALPVTTQEYLLSLVAAAGTGIAIKLLGVKKKLKAYEAGGHAA